MSCGVTFLKRVISASKKKNKKPPKSLFTEHGKNADSRHSDERALHNWRRKEEKRAPGQRGMKNVLGREIQEILICSSKVSEVKTQ